MNLIRRYNFEGIGDWVQSQIPIFSCNYFNNKNINKLFNKKNNKIKNINLIY